MDKESNDRKRRINQMQRDIEEEEALAKSARMLLEKSKMYEKLHDGERLLREGKRLPRIKKA